MNITKNLIIAVLMTIVTTLLLGVVYPLVVTGLAQVLFPDKANGQLIERNGKIDRLADHRPGILVARLLPRRGRRPPAPGTTRPTPRGTNLGPTNKKLIDAVKAAVDAAKLENPGDAGADRSVTSSASGLDPHISPAAAAFQVPRVARERGVAEAEIRRLVAAHTEGRQLGFLGEPVVNVLELNLALDAAAPDEEIARRMPDAPSAAESLLARAREEGRARLRVYIGAAPGVGKTYQMLEDAHELKRQGLDVVIGFIEPHGRADTLGADRRPRAGAAARDRVPRRDAARRWTSTAIKARRPQVAVVDELAHTNAPGSAHEKRYQDVLDAARRRHQRHHRGQHPAHRVAERRDRVDDRRPRARDDSRLGAEARRRGRQRRRLGRDAARRGCGRARSTTPRRSSRRSRNFFRKGNLTALRELALRQLASDQAGKAQEYRTREGLERPVIPEKVMVAMASRGSAKNLLRVGSRIAGRLATDWFAVYVETPKEEPGRIKPEDHVALADNIRFAQQLGAKVVKLKGSRVADLLVEFAKREGITHVIFGQSARSRWDLAMHGSIVDRFLRDVRNATVQIVPVRHDQASDEDATQWVDADDAADQAAARLRRLRAGARRARRVERAHAQPDERGVGPHHRRELRLGGRRPGHEGEPGAAGLGGAVRSARPAAIAPRRQVAEHRARFDAALGDGGGQHHRDRASARWSRRFAAAATTTTGASTRFSTASRRSHARLLPVARAAVQRGPRRMRSAAAPESGGDAAQGRRRVAHRAGAGSS